MSDTFRITGMGKDKREWRKLVKKLRRKRKRVEAARARDRDQDFDLEDVQRPAAAAEMEIDPFSVDRPGHDLEEAQCLERERQSALEFRMREAAIESRYRAQAKEKERIRKEWEQKQEEDKRITEEKERVQREAQEKKDEEFNQLLDFLAGDIETPPQPFLMPEICDDESREPCGFFVRTGACKYYNRCSRFHPKPTLSSIILIQNFFSHFGIDQGLMDEFDSDLTLEYEDSDLRKDFLEFYDDVLPEFQKCGKVVQFKVCCNFEQHLKGNVYIQYDTIREAAEAYRVFNGRFYNEKQLTAQFVRIQSWKQAICNQYSKRRCPNGKSCNFLHVFRNPTKEFVSADHDWAEPQRFVPRKPGGDLRDEILGTPSKTNTQNPNPHSENANSTSKRDWNTSSRENKHSRSRRSSSRNHRQSRSRRTRSRSSNRKLDTRRNHLHHRPRSRDGMMNIKHSRESSSHSSSASRTEKVSKQCESSIVSAKKSMYDEWRKTRHEHGHRKDRDKNTSGSNPHSHRAASSERRHHHHHHRKKSKKRKGS